jgi:hypothetical protein
MSIHPARGSVTNYRSNCRIQYELNIENGKHGWRFIGSINAPSVLALPIVRSMKFFDGFQRKLRTMFSARRGPRLFDRKMLELLRGSNMVK